MKIVITGVTRGIGRAMTDELIRLGHTVAGCGRNGRQIEELRNLYGPESFDVVDVRNDDEVRDWAWRVTDRFGAADMVINNAALANDPAPLWRVPRNQFDAIVDVNIKGAVNVIRHFVPPMLEGRSGVIVNVSSGWGRSVDAEVAPYCATKFAIEGLTKALAMELPEGMAAVPWSPGIIETDMLHQVFGEGAAQSPSPSAWARKAVPALLSLGAKDNGKSVSFR
jgi:NAD(P)-dependent dehydrogenase (short-subunit alcohol dehydrogenase family)